MSGGHLGREKTMEKIKQRAYWYGMSTDVRLYVATCRQCTVNKRSPRTMHAPLQNYQAGNPGDRVHLDILGPFCESQQGNKYVLMIIDQFTRWLEMVPLPVQDAESVAKAFFEYYIVRFGVPWCVHTDQGRNFDSDCSRPSVNCLMLWRHGPLRIDPVQMGRLNATISWCWTFCGVS